MKDNSSLTSVDQSAAPSVGHTALPWRVEEGTALIWGACDPDDKSTFGMGYPCAGANVPTGWKLNRPTPDEREANAALIVKAVNSHADLLKVAKQQAASYFRRYEGGFMHEGYRCLECREEVPGPRPDGLIHDSHCELAAAILKAAPTDGAEPDTAKAVTK